MKKQRYSEEQIAFALRQHESTPTGQASSPGNGAADRALDPGEESAERVQARTRGIRYSATGSITTGFASGP